MFPRLLGRNLVDRQDLRLVSGWKRREHRTRYERTPRHHHFGARGQNGLKLFPKPVLWHGRPRPGNRPVARKHDIVYQVLRVGYILPFAQGKSTSMIGLVGFSVSLGLPGKKSLTQGTPHPTERAVGLTHGPVDPSGQSTIRPGAPKAHGGADRWGHRLALERYPAQFPHAIFPWVVGPGCP